MKYGTLMSGRSPTPAATRSHSYSQKPSSSTVRTVPSGNRASGICCRRDGWNSSHAFTSFWSTP